MSMSEADDQKIWRRIVGAVTAEYAALPDAERTWLHDRLERMESLQVRLHGFFEKADGARLCRDCQGECCARGKHHLTLVNLLAILRANRCPPVPDFTSTCPFLGPGGCLLEVAWRPFNCLTFLCDQVEDRLGPADGATFYALERELRVSYEEFEKRYAGAGLRGLMIRAERLGGQPLLAPPHQISRR